MSFFSLTVFGVNLLAGDVHSSVTMDRHIQTWQRTGVSNLQLSSHLRSEAVFWASVCSFEAYCSSTLPFLLLSQKTPVLESLFEKVERLKIWISENLFKKWLQHSCFPVNIAKYLIVAVFIEHLRRLMNCVAQLTFTWGKRSKIEKDLQEKIGKHRKFLLKRSPFLTKEFVWKRR